MTQDELQKDVIEKVIAFYPTNKKGYLDLAMRSGKTRIAIKSMETMLYPYSKVLICYPDNKLKDVWIAEFEKWSPNIALKITYTNFSSLKKYTEDSFGLIVCDEFHALSLAESEYLQQITGLWWLFLSGTISKETKQKWPEFKEIYKFTTSQGIDNNILANYQITVHLVELDRKIKTPNKKGKFLTEKQKYDNYSYVISQMRYNGQNSMHLALARNRLSLSSIGKIEYTKKLLKKLEDKRTLVYCGLNETAKSLGICYYNSESAEDSVFMNFLEGRVNHLALSQMGKTGVTFPNLDSVILLNYSYNAAESSQILNRAIKLDYKGKIADLHVICLNEPPELKKVKESLSMLDQSKIKYI